MPEPHVAGAAIPEFRAQTEKRERADERFQDRLEAPAVVLVDDDQPEVAKCLRLERAE